MHTTPRISGREPGQNEYRSHHDEFAHLTLLGKVGAKLVGARFNSVRRATGIKHRRLTWHSQLKTNLAF
jgi:hypothetical protein